MSTENQDQVAEETLSEQLEQPKFTQKQIDEFRRQRKQMIENLKAEHEYKKLKSEIAQFEYNETAAYLHLNKLKSEFLVQQEAMDNLNQATGETNESSTDNS